jgi:hypothetical protein
MDSGVEVYRLGPASQAAARRAVWITLGAVYLFLLLVLAVVGLSLETVPTLYWWLFPVTGAIFAGAGVLGNRNSAREHALFGIAIGPDVLRRVSSQFPVVEMVRGDVVRVEEFPAGLLLYAEGPPRAVLVPSKLEGYARVRELIAGWKAPEIRAARKRAGLVMLAGNLLGLLAFLSALMGPDGWVLASASAAFLGLAGFAAWRVISERYLDPKARRVILGWLCVATAILAFRWALPLLRGMSR